MAIPKGSRVRQIVPAIEGETQATRFNEGTGKLEYLVPYTGADGEQHERWFSEDELEVVKTTDTQKAKPLGGNR